MQIEQLIFLIQKRPKMFIKEEKIEYIYYLLLGYCAATGALSDEIDQKFCCWFGKWLMMWIERNIKANYIPKTAYWYDDIKVIAKNDHNEVALFYELCKKFFEDYKDKVGYFACKN